LDFEPGHWKKQLPAKNLNLARTGNLQRLESLLGEHPEFLSKRGSHGRTLLWEAARAGKMAVVRMLVDRGADVNATGCYNSETLVQISPYCAARYYRRGEVADHLWAHGSTLDVFRAAFLGDIARVEKELASQPELLHAEDPNDEIYYIPLLSFAVAGGHADLMELLIRRGAQVVPYSAQLLGLAARSSRRDLIDVLLAHGADARAVGVGVFVDVSNLELLRYLLSRGVSPHRHAEGGFPPLVYVARGDKGERPDKVLLLLDHGAEIDATGPTGKTALHYAATAGHARVVRLLLERGANASLVDNDGHTPLDLARTAGKVDCGELLVSHGAKG
jgi:ankyrin repeat protein